MYLHSRILAITAHSVFRKRANHATIMVIFKEFPSRHAINLVIFGESVKHDTKAVICMETPLHHATHVVVFATSIELQYIRCLTDISVEPTFLRQHLVSGFLARP